MNKPEEIESLEWFKMRIQQDALLLNVYEYKEVAKVMDLLVQEVDRAIFNKKNPIKEDSKIQNLQKKWCALYKHYFETFTKTKLLQKPSAAHFRQIESAIYKLKEAHTDMEGYLKYLFEDFFPKNPTFIPQLGFTVSDFALENYLVTCRDEIQKKKEELLKQEELKNILNRYRVLVRKHNSKSEVQSILEKLYDEYKKGSIDILEFKNKVSELEEILEEKKTGEIE